MKFDLNDKVWYNENITEIIQYIKDALKAYKETHKKRPAVKEFKVGLDIYDILRSSPNYLFPCILVYGVYLSMLNPDWEIDSNELILEFEE